MSDSQDANVLLGALRRIATKEWRKVTMWVREDPDDPQSIFIDRLEAIEDPDPPSPAVV